MDKKPEALSAAFFDARSKLSKIKQFDIKPDMTQEAIDELVENLSTAKAMEDGGKVADYRSGQDWYIQSLIEFSAMSPEQQLDHCYTRKFAEQATETEMLDALAELAA